MMSLLLRGAIRLYQLTLAYFFVGACRYEPSCSSYAAEAGLFQRAGIPTVLCGPGSILQAHQPDEWIEESQIAEGAAFMDRLIARLRV
jgi:acetylornithine deacetylase/succinyl-diaminopimelate desuccinylase-like protein